MENVNMNANSKVTPLTIEALRVYKKQNPAKFAHKFGDLDLDNLPEGFTIEDANKIRYLRTQALPKPKLMTELQIQNINFAEPKKELTLEEVAAFLESKGLKVAEKKDEIVADTNDSITEQKLVATNVEGGEILEDKKEE